MSKIDYGIDLFSDDGEELKNPDGISNESDDSDIRPNLRIVPCCANCLYFWYRHGAERRGYCRLPIPEKVKGAPAISINQEAAKGKWVKIHATCLCDNYKVRSYRRSVNFINRWVYKTLSLEGIKFDEESGPE